METVCQAIIANSVKDWEGRECCSRFIWIVICYGLTPKTIGTLWREGQAVEMQALIDTIRHYWVALQNGTLPELGAWNYVLLSVLIVIQGPVATLLGGAAAAAGLLRPGYVLLSGVIGNLMADVLWYSTGHAGKINWILRYSRWLGVRRSHLDKLLDGMRQHSTKILLLAKVSAGLAVPALLAAGLSRVRWRKWFPVVFLGETAWTGSLVLVGYYTTEVISKVEQEIRIIAIAFSALLLLSLVWLIPHAIKHNKILQLPANGEVSITAEDHPN